MSTASFLSTLFRRYKLTSEKKRFLRKNLRSILAWPMVCLGLGILLYILLVSLLNSMRQNLEDKALAEAKVLAAVYAQQIARTVGELDHVTAALNSGLQHSKDAFRLEEIQTEASIIDTSMAGISLADRNGIIVSSTIPGAVGGIVRDRPYFRFHQANQSPELQIALPLNGRFGDKEIVVFSRRISLPDGDFGGVVSASTGTRFLAEFANKSMLGDTGLLALVGQDGALRAAKIGSEIESVLHPLVIRKPVLELRPGFSGQSGSGWFSDNMVRYLASEQVPGYPLHAIVGLGQADILQPWRAAKWSYVQIGIAGACVLALFALVASIMSFHLAWRKHREASVRNTYRIATEGANEGFYMWRPVYGVHGNGDEVADYELVDCNDRGAEMYGMPRRDLLGSRLRTLYSGPLLEHLVSMAVKVMQTGFHEDEVETASAGGARSVWLYRRFVRAGDGIAVTLRDISERKLLEQEKSLLAERDNLTSLPNRHWLAMYLPSAIQRAAAAGDVLAVLFIDLDKFKIVNDSWGHSTGDQLLTAVAERMRSVLRPSDKLARFGGDEFIVLLEGMEQESDAAEVARRLAGIFEQPFHLGPRECRVGASIGISLFPRDGTEAETLIRNADVAMYDAKADAKTHYRFFNHELFARIQRTWETERELAHALESDQLVVHYQPRVDSLTGALVGLEALVRWNHPARGLVYPNDFIPIAESTGLILRLGQLVMEKVCLQLAQWRAEGMRLVPVSVNTSARQFNEASVKDLLAYHVNRHHLPPSLVEIELTESIMVSNAQQVFDELTALRAMGVSVHLDDFGTGYSSLSMLHKLDVDVLKVDRAFTAQLCNAEEGQVLFKAIISMAKALGMRVVAEGVETTEQLRLLQQLGCDEVQGFLISRALPAKEISGFHFAGMCQLLNATPASADTAGTPTSGY